MAARRYRSARRIASLSGIALALRRDMRVVSQLFRFLAVVLAGLALSLVAAHALEMPGKLRLAPSEYLTVQQIYAAFPALEAIVEPAAVVCAIVLAFLARRGRAVRPALIGALCLVAALLIWVAIVNPVNAQWATAGSAPDNFESLRTRWEWGQAARAALLLAGFVALVIAVLTDMSAAAADAVRRTVPQVTRANAADARSTVDENAADVMEPPDRNAAA
jgi:hypothetical protein